MKHHYRLLCLLFHFVWNQQYFIRILNFNCKRQYSGSTFLFIWKQHYLKRILRIIWNQPYFVRFYISRKNYHWDLFFSFESTLFHKELHFIWINFILFGFKQFLRAVSSFAAAWHCKFLISICFCFRITRLLKRSEKSEAFDRNVSIFHLLSEKATTEFKLKCIILKALKKKHEKKLCGIILNQIFFRFEMIENRKLVN